MIEFIKGMYKKEGVRYIFFGGCTTMVNLVSYALLRGSLGINMTMANFISILLAILFAYAVNRRYVFESRTQGFRAVGREFAGFVGMRLSTMFIEIFGVVFLSCLWSVPEAGAKLGIQVVVLVLNYIFSKFFVFAEKNDRPLNPIKRNCCIMGFAVPAVTVAIAFAVNRVFPFGDRGVLIIDSLHQYLPFFTEFHGKLTQGESLRYSFGGGLGFNFWATYAYYLASPVNFLLVLFSKRHVMDAMALFIVLKIGLCGLTATWYFSSKSKARNYSPVLFGTMFALSSFMIGYYFNLMWLDSIAMLPLMMMGIERIIRGDRADLYCLSLFYGLYCNYYIGFMLCFFACLYFLIIWAGARRINFKSFLRSCIDFGWHSLLAGGMAAVVLVPAYVALGATASADNSFPQTVKLFVENLSQLTSQFALCEPINIADDQIGVNAFCGTAALILGVLYAFDRKTFIRERIAKLCLLLFLFVSFDINVLNYMWHGFHVQNGLPNRFAFIYIFLLLTLAFDAWRHLRMLSPRRVIPAVALPVWFTAYAWYKGLGERDWYTYGATMLLLCIYGILLLCYRTGKLRKTTFRAAFLGLGILEMIAVGTFGVFCNGTVGRSTYLEEQSAYERMIADRTNAGFFRSEMDGSRMRNENMFLGADGVVLFSSTMPAATVDICKSLGIEARTNKNGYNGYTKLMNDVFGVRYVISRQNSDTLYQMKKVDHEGSMTLYQNEHALGLGFMVDSSIRNWNTQSLNHFGVQNDFAAFSVGEQDLFYLEDTIEMEDGGSYDIPLPAGEQVYLDMVTSVEKLEVTTPEYSKTYETYTDHLYDLGCADAITHATVKCTLKDDQAGPVRAEIWRCRQEDYERVNALLAKNQLTISRVSDGSVDGDIMAERDGTLMLTIPYDRGWSAWVDGKPTETYVLGGALTGIDLKAGKHSVRLRYTPEGLWPGTLISLVCIALYLFSRSVEARRRRALAERKERETQDTDASGAMDISQDGEACRPDALDLDKNDKEKELTEDEH